MTDEPFLSAREIERIEKQIMKIAGPWRPNVDLFGNRTIYEPLTKGKVQSLRRKITHLVQHGYPKEHISPHWLERAGMDDI